MSFARVRERTKEFAVILPRNQIMRRAIATLVAVSAFGVSWSAGADDMDRKIHAAVKACVEVVRTTGEGAGFNKAFDAYYNSATKQVENNVTTNWGLSSLFEFR